jgi:tetratricopeptide (TPR) repeat protein
MENLATDLSHVDDDDEAEPLVRRALAIRQQLGERQTADVAFDLALIGVTMRDDVQAREDLLRQGLAMQMKLLGPVDPQIANTLYNLGGVLLDEDKPEKAKPFVEQSLEMRRILDPDHPDVQSALTLLREVLIDMEDWRDLGSVLRDHYAWETKHHPNETDFDDLQDMVRMHRALHEADQVKASHERLQNAISRKLSDLQEQMDRRPSDAGPIEERASIEGRFGRFRGAADDFGKAIALDPERHDNWYYRVCLLAYLGDDNEYRTACHDMLKRFGGASDVDIIDRTANRALQIVGDDTNKRAWMNLCKGMALYRRGQYAASVQSLEVALEPMNIGRHSMAELFLAMAHQQLGKADLARADLESAKQMMDRDFHNAEDGDASLDGLENWLMIQVARAQAEAICSETTR